MSSGYWANPGPFAAVITDQGDTLVREEQTTLAWNETDKNQVLILDDQGNAALATRIVFSLVGVTPAFRRLGFLPAMSDKQKTLTVLPNNQG